MPNSWLRIATTCATIPNTPMAESTSASVPKMPSSPIAKRGSAIELPTISSIVRISAIGVFGIVAQVVAMRSHEFGIRAALGASPARLTLLGLRVGIVQAGAGLAIGVALALVLTRSMRTFLHGVTPADPATFVLVLVVTGVVAVVASTWPARRASRADPAAVLQES